MTLDTLQMSISHGIVAASRTWRRIAQTTLIKYGISEACAMPLLTILRMGDGVRQVTVAQASGLESPSLVRLLDQLCAADIVCRTEDPTDRRAKSLSLTDRGRALALSIEVELQHLRSNVLSNIEPADLEATLRVLNAFREAGLPGADGSA
jgi:MarR family transcriptional regulator, transcriptional regulator for hemolysin